MKIALITLRFNAPGGVESTVRELALGLQAAGEEVTVYASELYDEGRWEKHRDFPPTVSGIPVRWFPVFKKLLPGITLPLWVGLIDALREDAPDVIHAHSHRYGHVLEAAAAAHGCGIPFVVSPHYHPADLREPPSKRMLLRGQDFLFGVTAYRVANRILVETEHEASQLREFAPAAKVMVLPPGVNLLDWEADAPKGAALPEGLPDRYLLFAGRIASNKGLDFLINALARLPPSNRVPVVLLGRDWGEQARLVARAKELGVDSSLVWAGHVEDRALYREFFRHAAGFVLPSEYEAFGLVLLEAMAAGLPIAATSVGGVPEVLEQGKDGILLPYGNAEALATALTRLFAPQPLPQQVLEHNRARAREFSTTKMVERHREAYRHAVGINQVGS
ncbi:MAG: glycosyltransferase family 4 protein [Thermoplasmata archaeon]|nr:glycosyltransferase family 4 protein [Thermoplasmata archaeon]